MRGGDHRSEELFSYVSCEARVPTNHPLRAIRAIVDEALKVMSADFDVMYSRIGRPSISHGASCPSACASGHMGHDQRALVSDHIDTSRAAEILGGDEFALAVRDDEELWRSRGISSVPAIIIDEKYLVSGGQPVEVFDDVLKKIAAAPLKSVNVS